MAAVASSHQRLLPRPLQLHNLPMVFNVFLTLLHNSSPAAVRQKMKELQPFYRNFSLEFNLLHFPLRSESDFRPTALINKEFI